MKRYNDGIWEKYKKLKSEFNSLKRKAIRNMSDFSKMIIADFSEIWKM